MAAAQTEPTPEERRALFRVIRGEPTDAEVAALTVALVADLDLASLKIVISEYG